MVSDQGCSQEDEVRDGGEHDMTFDALVDGSWPESDWAGQNMTLNMTQCSQCDPNIRDPPCLRHENNDN